MVAARGPISTQHQQLPESHLRLCYPCIFRRRRRLDSALDIRHRSPSSDARPMSRSLHVRTGFPQSAIHELTNFTVSATS